MMRKGWPAYLLLSLMALVACAGLFGRPAGEVGEVVTVQGTVQEVDLTAMAADGPAVIRVSTDGYGQVTIYVQSCLGGCALKAVDQLDQVQPGQVWRATGEVLGDGSLAIYRDEVHGLQAGEGP